MPSLSTVAKRLLLGRPFRSDTLSHTLLSKRLALPVFASDAMSSVAYAPQEIFLTLSVSGLAAYAYAPWIGVVVALVMLVVVTSYRQNVHAYPPGEGITRSPRSTSASRPASPWPVRCSSTTP